MSALAAVSLLARENDSAIWRIRMGFFYFTCSNGSVNSPLHQDKIDTKPQPQWIAIGLRVKPKRYHHDWAKMIMMKTDEPVFSGTVTINTVVRTETSKLPTVH
jgi:hypothetical protein